MSNLKLPNMSHANLSAILSDLKLRRTRLAYATWAVLDTDGAVSITHHDSVIAVIRPGMVKVDTCGWDSMTTASRLNRVVVDNGLPYRISIRQGDTKIMTDSLAIIAPLTTATFKDGVLI